MKKHKFLHPLGLDITIMDNISIVKHSTSDYPNGFKNHCITIICELIDDTNNNNIHYKHYDGYIFCLQKNDIKPWKIFKVNNSK